MTSGDFRTKGTKEWADWNINPIKNGCKHNCLYCYARGMKCVKFGELSFADWANGGTINTNVTGKSYGRRKGRGMIPTSSDITPDRMDVFFELFENLLKPGNHLLVTSKPHLEVIQSFCERFSKYKSQVQFRFTITTLDEELAKFWERGAPSVQERLDCGEYVVKHGWKASYSVEPFLDADPVPLVRKLLPITTESVWVGTMNYKLFYPREVVKYDQMGNYYIPLVKDAHSFDSVKRVYSELRKEPLVRWKDSVGNILGIKDINGPASVPVTLDAFIKKKKKV